MKIKDLLLRAVAIALLAWPYACSNSGTKVKRVRPDFSSLQGAEEVRIEGSGFRDDVSYEVYFGTQRAPTVSVVGTNSIAATTPGVDEPGRVDVRIVSGDGQTFLLKKAFRYVDSSIDTSEFFGGKKMKNRQHR